MKRVTKATEAIATEFGITKEQLKGRYSWKSAVYFEVKSISADGSMVVQDFRDRHIYSFDVDKFKESVPYNY